MAVGARRQIIVAHRRPSAVDRIMPFGVASNVAEFADLAVERDVRQFETEIMPSLSMILFQRSTPRCAVLGVVVAQPHVQRGQRRHVTSRSRRRRSFSTG